jgi:hypothetical protein
MTMDEKTRKKLRENARYTHCLIPNDEHGEWYVKMMRVYLNTDRYYITKKYQYAKDGATSNAYGIAKEDAKYIRIYINEKAKVRKNGYIEQQENILRTGKALFENAINRLNRNRD